MKKILVFFIVTLVAGNTFAIENVKKVFISQFVDHPALNMTSKGIIEGLEKNGYKKGSNLDLRIESAQADSALASQIAAKFINQNADTKSNLKPAKLANYFEEIYG